LTINLVSVRIKTSQLPFKGNQMSLKLKALAQLVTLIAIILGISFGIQFLTRETITDVFVVAIWGGLLWCFYNMLLARLEYQRTLEQLNAKKED
jgi:hypothetical protein